MCTRLQALGLVATTCVASQGSRAGMAELTTLATDVGATADPMRDGDAGHPQPPAEDSSSEDDAASTTAPDADPAAVGAAEAANEFEEALNEELDAQETAAGTVTGLPRFLEIGDQKLYIQKAIKEMGLPKEKRKTTARFGPGGGRVADALRGHGTAAPVELALADDDKVRVGDNVGALVLFDNVPTMVVGEVTGLKGPHGVDAAQCGLTVPELIDRRTEARLRVQQEEHVLASTRGGGGGSLWFDGTTKHKTELKVGGNFLVPLTFETHVVRGKLSTEVKTLQEVADALWLRVDANDEVVLTMTKAPAAMRHSTQERKELFVVAKVVDTSRKCSMCSKILTDTRDALKHNAAHRVVDYKKLRPETCALCLGPAENCPVFVVGSNQQPRVVCRVFAPTASADAPDDGVKFKAKSLAKSTDGAPSTNRPVVCPLCHPELADPAHLPSGATQKKKRKAKYRPAIWSYNAVEHHKRLHKSSVMPPAFFNACNPSDEELAKLKKLLK